MDMYNAQVLLWAGVITLLCVIGFFSYLQYRHKKPFGEVLTVIAAEQSEQVFILLTAIAFLAEAWTAASVHVEGIILPNPLSRFMLHMFIAVIGFVAPLTMFREATFVFAPSSMNIDFITRAFKFLIFFLLLGISIGSPYANLVLLSGNIGESQKLSLFFANNHPFISDVAYQTYLQNLGYPASYDAFSSLNPSLQASVTVSIFHVTLIFLASLQAIASPSRRKMLILNAQLSEQRFNADMDKATKTLKDGDKKKEEKKAEEEKKDKDKSAPNVNGTKAPANPPMRGEERAMDTVKDNILSLLQYYGYNEAGKRNNVMEEAYKRLYKIQEMDVQSALNIAARIASLVANVDTLNRGLTNQTEANRMKADTLAGIKAIFENPDGDKQPGLEVKLHSRKN